MHASYKGHVDVVNTLIGARAAVDTQDKDGWTGLMRASQKGHADIVNALIGARAELDTQDKKKYRTAIWYAPKRGRHSEIEEALRAASRHPN